LLALKFSPRDVPCGGGGAAWPVVSPATGAGGRGWAATVDAANIVRMPNSGSDNVRRFDRDKWNLPHPRVLSPLEAPPVFKPYLRESEALSVWELPHCRGATLLF
jgi:hypothetical protein